jgi:transcriptional regulator with XRE-family HTH domain
MDIREILAINLRKLRQARGLSQEELAYRAEIDRTYISALERSVYAAGIDVVDRLARALGVEAADLNPSDGARRKEKGSEPDRRLREVTPSGSIAPS